MLNFGRFDSILRNNSRKTSHKWFILSTFLAQCAITYVNFQEVYLRFGERGGGRVVRKYILTVYISSKHLAFLTVARTCKYEFPVFTRSQLCNALSHGNTRSMEYRRRGDVYKYEDGRARSLPSNGSKWLCRWAANKSAVRKSGYALLCVRPPVAYLWRRPRAVEFASRK